jgi:hypothetical protein
LARLIRFSESDELPAHSHQTRVDFLGRNCGDSESAPSSSKLKLSNPKFDFFIAHQGGEEGRNRASGKESGTGTGSRLGTAHQPKNQVSVPDFSCSKISEGKFAHWSATDSACHEQRALLLIVQSFIHVSVAPRLTPKEFLSFATIFISQ